MSPTRQRRPAPDPRQRYAVRYVVDGDTIDVGGVGRLRLIGIDAPELGFGFDTAAPFGREAKDYLATLLLTRWVRLESDGERHDRYGRALAYVIRDDGLFVNAEMLRAGLARVSARMPLQRLTELRRAESEAQRARRGIWGERPSVPSPSFTVPRAKSRRISAKSPEHDSERANQVPDSIAQVLGRRGPRPESAATIGYRR